MNPLLECFGSPLPFIGVIQLPPLPDRPGSPGIDGCVEHALESLAALQEGGADGALVVNDNDKPHRIRAQPETISAMTRITRTVVERSRDIAVGCQILLNDPIASLAVARTTGADFIRCDHFVDPMRRAGLGVMITDPDGLLAYRREIDATRVLVLADIQIRDATMLEERSLRESARLAALHHADAIIVTGEERGRAPPDADLRDALAGIADSGHDVPLLLGGGLTADNAASLLSLCDGAFVSTSLRRAGHIDAAAVRDLAERIAALRKT